MLPVFLKYLAIGVVAILALMVLVKLVMVVSAGIGPLIDTIVAGANMWFERFVYALITAIVVYVLIISLLGKYISPGIRVKIIPLTLIAALIYSVAPALGTAVGQILLMVLGIAMIVTLFFR